MVKYGKARVTLVAIILYHFVKLTECSGRLEIKLESYQNPHHKLADGQCCVAETSTCRQECSNQFNICVSSTSATGTCNMGQTDLTHLFGDDETFDVGQSESRFKNPLTYSFNEWKGGFEITIKVLHDGTGSVGTFTQTINALPQNSSGSTWETKTLLYKRRSRHDKPNTIVFGVRAICDDGYKGANCSISTSTCTPRDDDQGHYTCNTTSQQKVCLGGWGGRECTMKLCTPSNSDEGGHYTCNVEYEKVCLGGWWSPETNCTVRKCVPQNDGKNGHFRCDLNNNTKICLPGWLDTALNCTVKECVSRNDEMGHYRCDKNNTMVCLNGWTNPSTNCTIDNSTTTTTRTSQVSAPSSTVQIQFLFSTVLSITPSANQHVSSTSKLSSSASVPPSTQIAMETSSPTTQFVLKPSLSATEPTPLITTTTTSLITAEPTSLLATEPTSHITAEPTSLITTTTTLQVTVKVSASISTDIHTSKSKTPKLETVDNSKTSGVTHSTNIVPSASESTPTATTTPVAQTTPTPKTSPETKKSSTPFKVTAQPSVDVGVSKKSNKDYTVIIVVSVASVVFVAWIGVLVVAKRRATTTSPKLPEYSSSLQMSQRYDQRQKIRPITAEHNTNDFTSTSSVVSMKQTRLTDAVV